MDEREIINNTVFDSNDNGKNVFADLLSYKYFSYLLFYLSIFQLLAISGLTILSPLISLFTIILCSFIYFILKDDKLNLDIKYQKSYAFIRINPVFFALLAILSIVDLSFTFVFSKNKINNMIHSQNLQRKKFCILIILINSIKVLCYPFMAFFALKIKKSIELL